MNDADFRKLSLQEHSHPGTRWLHAIGTLSSWGLFFSAWFFGNWWLALLALVIGYGFAWSSHALIERNRPLSMRYPVRSFREDYRLTLRMLLFRTLEHKPDDSGSTGGSR